MVAAQLAVDVVVMIVSVSEVAALFACFAAFSGMTYAAEHHHHYPLGREVQCRG